MPLSEVSADSSGDPIVYGKDFLAHRRRPCFLVGVLRRKVTQFYTGQLPAYLIINTSCTHEHSVIITLTAGDFYNDDGNRRLTGVLDYIWNWRGSCTCIHTTNLLKQRYVSASNLQLPSHCHLVVLVLFLVNTLSTFLEGHDE